MTVQSPICACGPACIYIHVLSPQFQITTSDASSSSAIAVEIPYDDEHSKRMNRVPVFSMHARYGVFAAAAAGEQATETESEAAATPGCQLPDSRRGRRNVDLTK